MGERGIWQWRSWEDTIRDDDSAIRPERAIFVRPPVRVTRSNGAATDFRLASLHE